MQHVFVAGAGTMGLGIAQVFAAAGFRVTVRDIRAQALEKARAGLKKALARRVEKGDWDAARADALFGAVSFTDALEAARDCDLAIEAIVEDMAEKKALFAALDALCPAGALLSTNTSSLSVTEIAAATGRADRCIGLHFFNPAPVMRLVEIVRGAATSDATAETARALCEAAGKTPVEVAEAPGFVVNRLLIPMINEACCLAEAGVASPEDIDRAMTLGANHPMGPLRLGDLIGLDVCLAIMDSLYDETRDPKFRAAGLLRKMVRAGRLGRKSGRGFYAY